MRCDHFPRKVIRLLPRKIDPESGLAEIFLTVSELFD
jgi:hypothetical protein